MFKNLPCETLYNILYDVSYLDIINIIRAYPKLSHIYNDTIFWKSKLNLLIRDKLVPSDYVTLYNVIPESWPDIYKRWEHKENMNIVPISFDKFMIQYNIDWIIWYLDHKDKIESVFDYILDELYILGITHNNLHILNYIMCSQYNINHVIYIKSLYIAAQFATLEFISVMPDIYNMDMANAAGHHNRIDILELLKEYNIYPTPYNYNVVNRHISVFDWLEQVGIKHDIHTANIALSHNRIDVLDWLSVRTIYPSLHDIDTKLDTVNVDTLDWLNVHEIYPSDDGIMYYIEKSCIEVLEWLVRCEVIFNSDQIAYIIQFDKISILQLISNVQHTSWSAGIALKYYSINVLYWLGERGIYPKQEDINISILHNIPKFKILDYLKHYNLYPDQRTIHLIVQNGMILELNWLLTCNIYPNQNAIIYAALYSPKCVLELLTQKGIYPDVHSINIIVQRLGHNIVKWYAERGIKYY